MVSFEGPSDHSTGTPALTPGSELDLAARTVDQTPAPALTELDLALRQQQAKTPSAEKPQTNPEQQKINEMELRLQRQVYIRHRERTGKKVGEHNRDPREQHGVGPVPPDGVGEHLGKGYEQSLRALEINPGIRDNVNREADRLAQELREQYPDRPIDPNLLAQEITRDAAEVLGQLTYPSGDLKGPVILWDHERNEPPATRHQQVPMTEQERIFAEGSKLLTAGWEGRHLGLYARTDGSTEENRQLDAQARAALLAQISPAERIAFLVAENKKAGMLSPVRRDLDQAMKLAAHAPIGPYLDQVDRLLHDIPWGDTTTWKGMNREAFSGPATELTLKSLQGMGAEFRKEAEYIQQGLETWSKDNALTYEQLKWLEAQAKLVQEEGRVLIDHFGSSEDTKSKRRQMSNVELARQTNLYIETKVNPLRDERRLPLIPKIPILGQDSQECAQQTLAIVHGGIIPSLPNAPYGIRQQGPGSPDLQQRFHYTDKAITMATDIHRLPGLYDQLRVYRQQRGATKSLDDHQWQQVQTSQRELELDAASRERLQQQQRVEAARAQELQDLALTVEIERGPTR